MSSALGSLDDGHGVVLWRAGEKWHAAPTEVIWCYPPRDSGPWQLGASRTPYFVATANSPEEAAELAAAFRRQADPP